MKLNAKQVGLFGFIVVSGLACALTLDVLQVRGAILGVLLPNLIIPSLWRPSSGLLEDEELQRMRYIGFGALGGIVIVNGATHIGMG